MLAGKNLLSLTAQSISKYGVDCEVTSDGHVIFSGVASSRVNEMLDWNLALPAGKYTLSGAKDGEANVFVTFKDDSGTTQYADGYPTGVAHFTLTKPTTVYLTVDVRNAGNVDCTLRPQLELGDTATDYEPPNINTVPIDLQGNELCSLPDGTRDVLDVVTGVIEKSTMLFEPDGSEDWAYEGNYASTGGGYYYTRLVDSVEDSAALYNTNSVSDRFRVVSIRYAMDLSGVIGYGNGMYNFRIRPYEESVQNESSLAAFKQWLANNRPKFVLPLLAHETVQLTPPDFPALPEGTAHAWLSANDPMDPDFDLTYWTEYGKVVSEVKDEADHGITAAQDSAANASETAQDAMNELNSVRSEINVLTESISTLVTDGNGGSLMEQTEDGWTFNIGAIQSQLNNAVNSITDIQGDLSEKETVINAINGLVDDIAEKTAYINMTTDDEGSPCIELGESTSDFKLRITNTSIDFMQGTNKIAYITNESLYIQSSVVTDDFKIGSGAGFIWKRRSNGNMGLRWEAN